MDQVRLTLFFFQLPGLMYLPLAGQTGRTTARRHYLPLRELPAPKKNLMHSTLTLIHRFPNPIPAGTSLPQWTLLDVTLAVRR